MFQWLNDSKTHQGNIQENSADKKDDIAGIEIVNKQSATQIANNIIYSAVLIESKTSHFMPAFASSIKIGSYNKKYQK